MFFFLSEYLVTKRFFFNFFPNFVLSMFSHRIRRSLPQRTNVGSDRIEIEIEWMVFLCLVSAAKEEQLVLFYFRSDREGVHWRHARATMNKEGKIVNMWPTDVETERHISAHAWMTMCASELLDVGVLFWCSWTPSYRRWNHHSSILFKWWNFGIFMIRHQSLAIISSNVSFCIAWERRRDIIRMVFVWNTKCLLNRWRGRWKISIGWRINPFSSNTNSSGCRYQFCWWIVWCEIAVPIRCDEGYYHRRKLPSYWGKAWCENGCARRRGELCAKGLFRYPFPHARTHIRSSFLLHQTVRWRRDKINKRSIYSVQTK